MKKWRGNDVMQQCFTLYQPVPDIFWLSYWIIRSHRPS